MQSLALPPSPSSRTQIGVVWVVQTVMASVVEPAGCLVFSFPTPWRWSGVGLCQAWGQCQPTDGGVLFFVPPPSGLGKEDS